MFPRSGRNSEVYFISKESQGSNLFFIGRTWSQGINVVKNPLKLVICKKGEKMVDTSVLSRRISNLDRRETT